MSHVLSNDSAHLLGLHYVTITVLHVLQGLSGLIIAITQPMTKQRKREVKVPEVLI